MSFRLLAAIVACLLLTASTSASAFGRISPGNGDIDPGQPLFLTPFIRDGRIDEAKNLSRVGPMDDTRIASFSGFFTVGDPGHNSNMFFWFIPALNNPETAPVALWLQGGPGASSMLSLFDETGPWRVTPDLRIYDANYTWSSAFSMLYLDNPVGTGYSFTDSEAGYATDEDRVAGDLYDALQQFFALFADYRKRDFYVFGESYAGKYIPAIGHKIHVENQNASLAIINLRGVAIGNGLVDPKSQLGYGDFLYNAGLIDRAQRRLFDDEERLVVRSIDAGDLIDALRHFDRLVIGQYTRHDSYFKNFTGLGNIYNILKANGAADENLYAPYLDLAAVRRSIHVGNLTFNDGRAVVDHLLADIMNTTRPMLETLLDADYKVLVYGGIVDACIPYPVTENMIAALRWKHSAEYAGATRRVWKVHPADDDVAGYAKRVRNFQEVAVRNAGHMSPRDQPRATLDMIQRFVFGKPF